MKTQTLEHIGLTHNESTVYLTLLKTGTAKTGEILKTSNLNSGKIYEILDSLKKKGLVSESIINNIKWYTAAPPAEILEYLERKKEDLHKDETIIKKEIPLLEQLRNTQEKESKAVTYTGLRGIKTAAHEALNQLQKGDEILAMGISGKKDKKFNNFWLQFYNTRIKKKIKAKHIFSEREEYAKEFKKMPLTENRILESFTPVAVDIFGKDKVLILNYHEQGSCTLIYDKNTATSFRNFFYQLWNIAKP
jgi:sugar-specific transcriptional regulator TrmB